MTRRWLLALISINLLALLALVFIYPHLMVAPGALVAGHADVAGDCFACHAPLRGADSQRCVACHAVPDIGLRTTKGVAMATPAVKVSFHQDLIEKDCIACHTDHAGPKLTHRARKPFSHTLLQVASRERCESCHKAPTNNVHRDLSVGCAQCHETGGWTPATFDHALLAKAVLNRCEGCHKAPTDSLHRQIQGNCGQCHEQQRWKPATFDHDKLFLLDDDHNAKCVTCHVNSDYSRYTCYGCHEHTLANVREEHEEEGIRNFSNCVECHRSADEEPRKNGGGKRRERD
ncbi:conserved hypothetical protein [Leptothrix cholodnii SP-6]|uniref:Class III cytochrome C domain-containing protein n=1 Tax=Leptothrix cholodnii (strain ATCC 51168 / LMG 8142 / SP-6) TaxID=395495 RepID=B1Y4G6_LEPCP|nr:cytochrome c3 family protein [Leptothrix cholodnii]ACB33405.1 conserved hypothetical protein [Leptothrix cholodnii SP-6]